jgi:hypothetical protein
MTWKAIGSLIVFILSFRCCEGSKVTNVNINNNELFLKKQLKEREGPSMRVIQEILNDIECAL